MDIQVSCSEKKDVREAVAELKQKMALADPALVVFFASSCYDPADIAQEMARAFGSCPTMGCTTSGEIISGRMLKNSVVSMALGAGIVKDVRLEVVDGVPDESATKAAFKRFEDYYGRKQNEFDVARYVGMVLVDGLSVAEEAIMELIGAITNVAFIGGSAGDDLKFEKTFVFVNGKTYTKAAVLALIETVRGFDVIKTQSFTSLCKPLIATKVDTSVREVIEFNGKPALQAYAESLGVSSEEAKNRFMHNPVGVCVDDTDIFVRSPQQAVGDRMRFYCSMAEGIELSVLEGQDIVGDTDMAVRRALAEGDVAGIINFHCILRTLELEQLRKTEAYGKIFESVPAIGFSTYGEQYIGHVNQTSTMLVFK